MVELILHVINSLNKRMKKFIPLFNYLQPRSASERLLLCHKRDRCPMTIATFDFGVFLIYLWENVHIHHQLLLTTTIIQQEGYPEECILLISGI